MWTSNYYYNKEGDYIGTFSFGLGVSVESNYDCRTVRRKHGEIIVSEDSEDISIMKFTEMLRNIDAEVNG